MSDPADPIFDADAVARLTEVIGDSSTGRLIDLYLGEAQDLLATIAAGIATRNDEEVARAAHSLKSSSASVGALTVSTVSARVETMAQSLQLDAVVVLLEQLRGAFDDVRSLLTAESARLSGGP